MKAGSCHPRGNVLRWRVLGHYRAPKQSRRGIGGDALLEDGVTRSSANVEALRDLEREIGKCRGLLVHIVVVRRVSSAHVKVYWKWHISRSEGGPSITFTSVLPRIEAAEHPLDAPTCV